MCILLCWTTAPRCEAASPYQRRPKAVVACPNNALKLCRHCKSRNNCRSPVDEGKHLTPGCIETIVGNAQRCCHMCWHDCRWARHSCLLRDQKHMRSTPRASRSACRHTACQANARTASMSAAEACAAYGLMARLSATSAWLLWPAARYASWQSCSFGLLAGPLCNHVDCLCPQRAPMT